MPFEGHFVLMFLLRETLKFQLKDTLKFQSRDLLKCQLKGIPGSKDIPELKDTVSKGTKNSIETCMEIISF